MEVMAHCNTDIMDLSAAGHMPISITFVVNMDAAHAITGVSYFMFAVRVVFMSEKVEQPARSCHLCPRHKVGKPHGETEVSRKLRALFRSFVDFHRQ